MELLYILRMIATLILSLLCLICIVGNYILLLRYFIYGVRASLLPFLGGITGCLALFLLPGDFEKYWWIPLIIDPGTSVMAPGLLFAIGHSFREKSNSNEPPANGA